MSDKNTLGHGASAPNRYTLPQANAANVGRKLQYKSVCGKCGAHRIDQQLGSEPSPDCKTDGQAQCGRCFVCSMVAVFREVRRVLRDDGVLFVNLGDSYNGGPPGGYSVKQESNRGSVGARRQPIQLLSGNLLGMPWRVALALQADDWILRSDMPWVKRCLSGGAIVYARTQKGDMPTMVKDLVRLRPETVKLWNGERWTQVLGFHETLPDSAARVVADSKRRAARRVGKEVEVTGDLEIEFRSGERVACTRTHEWPTKRGILKAEDLKVGDTVPSVKIPQPERLLSPKLLDANEVGWAVGFFLAEGHIAKEESITSFSVHVSETGCFERIKELANSLGDSAGFKPREGNGATIHVYGKLFSALMSEYTSGETCYNKRLSTKAWQRSNEFLLGVANGYLEGDGHWDVKNDRWRIGFCDNDGLATDLRTLAARVDSRIRLRRTIHKGFNKEFPGWKGEWRQGSSCEDPTQGEIIAICAARSRKFWDISVADEPNTFALASGLLTHNSAMPESCTNRPAKALEYVFMFVKKMGYFFDMNAIRKSSVREGSIPGGGKGIVRHGSGHNRDGLEELGQKEVAASRNFRNADLWFQSVDSPHGLTGIGDEMVGLDVTSESYSEAHFATYGSKLVLPLILCSTSAKGCCTQCGTPWKRVVKERKLKRDRPNDKVKRTGAEGTGNSCGNTVAGVETETVGWTPGCECHGKFVKRKVKRLRAKGKVSAGWAVGSNDHTVMGHQTTEGKAKVDLDGVSEEIMVTETEYVSDMPLDEHPRKPCTVLDPFSGSGTTGMVAIRRNRKYIGIELSEAYIQMSMKRLRKGEAQRGFGVE